MTLSRSTKAGTVVPATPARIRRNGHRYLQCRSTKAGTVVPATQGTRIRHGQRARSSRSTKAGTVVPATQGYSARHGAGSGSRSTKAGTVVPATPEKDGRSTSGARRYLLPLNEGRDRSPGDTLGSARRRDRVAAASWYMRSTKAGTVVPATHPARLDAGRALHRQARSTKAGTVVPATLDLAHLSARSPSPGDTRSTCRPDPPGAGALNEGRDRSPGDTRCARRYARCPCPALNEGRDRSPGDTSRACCSVSGVLAAAQRRPGP